MRQLLSKFRSFNLPVDGIAILREMEGKNVLAIGDRTIDINSCNFGYIRTSGIKRYRQGQRITGCDFVNDVVEDLFLVLILDESKNSDAYLKAARQVLDSIDEVQITAIDINKESIQRAEAIPPSLRNLVRVSFTYTYQEVGDCESGICEYVADVECGIEPCSGQSFCERVLECLPDPVGDCTLDVGSGCCVYEVEGIDLRPRFCFDVIELNPPDSSNDGSMYLNFITTDFNTIFQNFPIGDGGILNNQIITSEEQIQNIIDSFDSFGNVFSYELNGIKLCVFVSENIPNHYFTVDYDGLFPNQDPPIDFYNFQSFGLNSNLLSSDNNTLVYEISGGTPLTFQVLINSEWINIPSDQIINGTWSTTSCDTITEWRILDAEEEIVASGEVTATCEGGEETKPICTWLQEHQTAIEELQNTPEGLNCETLPDCQIIIDIESDLANKANTADLGAVAFSNDYNDLDNLPSIPDVSGYVPYTGATQDVDLGTYKLTADAIAFDLNPTNGPGAGQIAYVGSTGALAYNMNSSQVTSQIGQTMHAFVHNAEGVQINKGQAVYLFGASGNKASVKLALNTSDATSAKTFGLAAENIPAGQNGFVITQGVLDGLNTGSYNAGDVLYLGATAGSLTTVKPYAPNHMVYIGIVERANNGNGQIYVRVQNGYELDEIHDVDLISTPPVNNDLLTYKTGANNLWKAQSLGTLLGGTTSQYVRGDGSVATLPNFVQVVGIDATANALTGAVTNGIVASVLIPANTMTTSTIVEFEAFIRKVSASAVANMRVHINTANNMTGAQQLAFLQGASNNVTLKMERSFIVTSTGLTIFPQGVTANIDDQQSTTAVTNLTVDWTVNQWLHLTANNAVGETTTNIFLFVKKSAP